MRKLFFILLVLLLVRYSFADTFQTPIKIIVNNNTLKIQGEDLEFFYPNLTIDLTQNITININRQSQSNISVENLLNITTQLNNITWQQYELIASQEIRDAYNRIIGRKDELNDLSKSIKDSVNNVTSWADAQVKYDACESQKSIMFTQDQKQEAEKASEKKGADGKSPNWFILAAAAVGLFGGYLMWERPRKVNQPGSKNFPNVARRESSFKRLD